MTFRNKLTANLAILAIVASIVTGLVAYHISRNALREHLESRLRSVASIAALTLSADDLSRLRTPADRKTPVFRKLQSHLLDLQQAVPSIKYIYVMRKSSREETLKFVIDPTLPKDENGNGRIEDNEAPAQIGEEYNIANYPQIKYAFSGPIADNEINQDKWGYWLSGYAPVRDHTGKAVAIVGVDMSAQEILRQEGMLRRGVAIALIVMLAVSVLLSFMIASLLAHPIQVMTNSLQRLRQRDYTARVPDFDKGEIGLMTQAFNEMSQEMGSLHAELNRRHQEMKKKVEERTRELEHTHALLLEAAQERFDLAQNEIALVNAALQERNQHLQIRQRQLQAIVDFQQVILRQTTLDELFCNGFAMLTYAYMIEAGAIFYMNPETMHPERKASHNLTDQALNALESVQAPGNPDHAHEVASWEASNAMALCALLEKADMGDSTGRPMDSVVSIPFNLGDRMVGWLVVVALTGRPIEADERDLLLVFGNEFAIAADNMERKDLLAKMHQELQQRHKDVQKSHRSLEEANRKLEAYAGELSQQTAELDALNQELSENYRQLEEANWKLSEMATTDALTGLASHRALHERLADEIRRYQRYHRPFSLMMVDIDDFKEINDRVGHVRGDRILQEIAAILQRNIRQTDFAARYGGDEMALILTETRREDAAIVGERICRQVATHQFGGVQVTVSVGIAEYTEEKKHQPLLEEADQAMYNAKRSGKNTVYMLPVAPQAA